MSAKIYLSPAAHENDRPCAFGGGCTENTHANLYLNELEPYLTACGFEVRRASRTLRGAAALQKAVEESNAFGADLHYVVHTNGADGSVKGSRPMVYPLGEGKRWAEVLAGWRRKIYPYPVTVRLRDDLYEILQSRAVCIYEELVFHDNAADAVWLHEHMRTLAEYTARAFCEIFGMPFTDPYGATGDVDGDGAVTTTDARLILQEAAGKSGKPFTEQQKAAADVDGDGEVTTTDARLTLQRAAGKGE